MGSHSQQAGFALQPCHGPAPLWPWALASTPTEPQYLTSLVGSKINLPHGVISRIKRDKVGQAANTKEATRKTQIPFCWLFLSSSFYVATQFPHWGPSCWVFGELTLVGEYCSEKSLCTYSSPPILCICLGSGSLDSRKWKYQIQSSLCACQAALRKSNDLHAHQK